MNNEEKTIILFEHSELQACDGDLENCPNCESCKFKVDNNACLKASKEQFKEIIKLCEDKNYNFALKHSYSSVKAKKYTGYLQLPDGTFVEILPKVYKNNADCNLIECVENSRKIFKNLLLASSNITREIKEGSLTSTKGGESKLLEILISIFCNEMENLLNKGIRKFYQTREENLPYLKGKIKFSEHIKRNIVSKEKFFVEFDDFVENIAENRILKSACRYLLSQTENDNNKKILRRCLVEFDDVEECHNLEGDLSQMQPNKLFKYYDNPLIYAEFFLRRKNFIPNRGNRKLPALFFPLDKMFEDYIKKLLEGFNIKYRYQSPENHLISKNGARKPSLFKTKPDFIVQKGNTVFILDAKYKIINLENDLKRLNDDDEENYYNHTGISQSDLYQVFTYSEILKKLNKNIRTQIALLYPENENFKTDIKEYLYFNGTKLTFIPVNLTSDKTEWLEKNDILREYLEQLK